MGFTTIAFDAYGTLLDVHAAIARKGSPLGKNAEAVSRLWRAKQLEYAWVRTLSGRYSDFEQVTEDALDFALSAHGVRDPVLKADLMIAYDRLAAYPDVAPALRALKERGLTNAIFTNGTERMIQLAVEAAGIEALVDQIITVEPVRQFKTMPATYAHLVAESGAQAEEIAFVSSNRWDAAGATASGIAAVWCNRTKQPDEYRDLPPIATIAGLEGLAAVVTAPEAARA